MNIDGGGWESVKTGLRLLIVGWIAEIALTIVNWLMWPILGRLIDSMSMGYASVFGIVNFIMEVAYTVAAIVLIAGAVKIMKLPATTPVDAPPGDPYRGNIAPQTGRDSALDSMSMGLLISLIAGVVLSLLQYLVSVFRTVTSGPYERSIFDSALRVVTPLVYLAGGVLFALWAGRAARTIGRPVQEALPGALMGTLAVRALISISRILLGTKPTELMWLPSLSLILSIVATILSVVLALAVIEAIRTKEQPFGGPYGGPYGGGGGGGFGVPKQPLQP